MWINLDHQGEKNLAPMIFLHGEVSGCSEDTGGRVDTSSVTGILISTETIDQQSVSILKSCDRSESRLVYGSCFLIWRGNNVSPGVALSTNITLLPPGPRPPHCSSPDTLLLLNYCLHGKLIRHIKVDNIKWWDLICFTFWSFYFLHKFFLELKHLQF